MRLIGNKTRLLGEIERFLSDRGVRGGTLFDVFCGTASVSRHFKALGFRVVANDHLSMCYTKAVADVEVSEYPALEKIRKKCAKVMGSPLFQRTLARQGTLDLGGAEKAPGDSLPPEAAFLRQVIHLLNEYIEPAEGLIFRNYCPGGAKGRMYFSDENGRRIDGILQFLRAGFRDGDLSHAELHVLLSSLLDAADRVANISGTYGAYLKKWQRNTLQPLHLRVPEIILSRKKHQAFQEDGNELVRRVKADVLYIDPPYNKRQYPANYHILDVMARFHAVEDPELLEASLYGKTGLCPYDHLKSAYCVPPSARSQAGNVLSAMTDLILSSHAQHVLVSYNEEGLLTRDELGSILSRFAGVRAFDFKENMRIVPYRRFRSDSDRAPGDAGGKRQYRILEGKEADHISEWLLYARRAGTSRRRAGVQS